VQIVTPSEGEITHLHVGLKGTMNARILEDLADKTRRGLRGRVEQGFGREGARVMCADRSAETAAVTAAGIREAGGEAERACSGSTGTRAPRHRGDGSG
jgi:hypothetical protein